MHLCKGLEIAAWLSEYETQDTRYVIIDDKCVTHESQSSNFILTNPFNVITTELAYIAISILNKIR